MLQPYGNNNWSIFTPMHEAIREKELKRLRLSKCPKCNKVTFYRLKTLGSSSLSCKNCNNKLQTYSPLIDVPGVASI
ncbi:hypothetical protein KAI12_04135 [Candidatus Bathyarchaeota archaeon]|nr:hypothetical protein [Candidatus Bathyarchaeota archaeon]